MGQIWPLGHRSQSLLKEEWLGSSHMSVTEQQQQLKKKKAAGN